MNGGRPGTFILSLDCEGKWGMADCLDRRHQELLTSVRLIKAYETLADMFGRFDIQATFAFVMALLLEQDDRQRFDELLLGNVATADPWLEQYRRARSAGTLEGWHLPEALAIVRSGKGHEIACHGFCHRPLADDLVSAAQARAELEAAVQVAHSKQIDLQTFIFPRNEVGHLDEIRKAGFVGYRTALRRVNGMGGRAIRIAEELNLWRLPQQSMPVADNGLVPIPAGYFFNWRYGTRRLIPPEITQMRWRNLLRRGARGGVVHLWLHPHNLVTASDTAHALERFLAEVAEARAAGRIRIATQAEYCREQLSSAAP